MSTFNPTPPVSCKYGAPMGRPGSLSHQGDPAPLRFHLQHVPLDNGGYDRGGAYWGIGPRLYWYCADDGSFEGYLRSHNRTQAKAAVRESFPNAKFFR